MIIIFINTHVSLQKCMGFSENNGIFHFLMKQLKQKPIKQAKLLLLFFVT